MFAYGLRKSKRCGKNCEAELAENEHTIGIEGDESEHRFNVQFIRIPEGTEYIYIRGILGRNAK